MVKYLQLNGTSDYLRSPSMTFDEVIMEFKARYTPTTEYYIDVRTGIANSYLYRNTSNVDFTSGSSLFVNGMYWNGTKFANSTAAIPYDTRGILRLVLSTAGTDDPSFFANNAGTASTLMAADVFSIKLLLGGVVKAFYDMTTGTVQDQSGNGNHATLTGGTWLDDGTGGTPTGTDGTTAFDLKQSIYSDSSVNADTKLSLYSDSLTSADTKQALYQDGSVVVDSKQMVFSDSSVAYDTLQDLIDNTYGSTQFDIQMILYADSQTDFDMKQTWYAEGSFQSDLLQILKEPTKPIISEIHLTGGLNAVTRLTVTSDAPINLRTKNTTSIHLKGGIQ